MNSLTDPELLRDYFERRSEAAFAELVRRHIDFVYSASLRMVRDRHLAEDVTQSVFVALGQNARQLMARPVLSGWLHRTAQNLAANCVRSEVRRRAREQEAAAMNELLATESDVVWDHIAPHLDAALGELSEADRDALLLRYFERKSAREMAQTLGTSEEAAQKRVSRAVERLREYFARRGITVGASGLVAMISANAVQAAPVGLAVTISTASALASTSVTKAIAMTTLQKTLITATIAAAVATPFAIQHQIQTKLRDENQSLRQQLGQLAPRTAENERLLDLNARARNAQKISNDQFSELLKLRNEVGMLRKQTNEMVKLRGENDRLRKEASASAPSDPSITNTVQLFTRTYKINPAAFVESLNREVKGPSEESTTEKLRKFLEQHAVTFDPPSAIFFNDRTGQLMVRNSLTNLAAVETVVEFLNAGK